MSTYKGSATVIAPDTLHVPELHMTPGEEVDVEISTSPQRSRREKPDYPLRGTVLRYDRPFDPAVRDEDWDTELFPVNDEAGAPPGY